MTREQFRHAADAVTNRWPDSFLALNPESNRVEIHAVGTSTKRGRPIAYIEPYDGEVIEL